MHAFDVRGVTAVFVGETRRPFQPGLVRALTDSRLSHDIRSFFALFTRSMRQTLTASSRENRARFFQLCDLLRADCPINEIQADARNNRSKNVVSSGKPHGRPYYQFLRSPHQSSFARPPHWTSCTCQVWQRTALERDARVTNIGQVFATWGIRRGSLDMRLFFKARQHGQSSRDASSCCHFGWVCGIATSNSGCATCIQGLWQEHRV